MSMKCTSEKLDRTHGKVFEIRLNNNKLRTVVPFYTSLQSDNDLHPGSDEGGVGQLVRQTVVWVLNSARLLNHELDCFLVGER